MPRSGNSADSPPPPPPGGFFASRKRTLIEFGLIVCGIVGAIWLAFAIAAWMADTMVKFVPVSADETVGEAAWPTLAPPSQRCTNPAALRYVEHVTSLLLEHADDRRFQFELAVLDDPTVNAAALPGGFVVVHYGLLEQVESGEEVAGVLAHELSHVFLRHGMGGVLRRAGGQMILGMVFGVSDIGVLAEYGGELVALRYDRDQERAADALGRRLLMRAGFSPDGLATFFARLAADGSSVPAFLSTHPPSDERARETERASRTFTPSRRVPPPVGLSCH